MSGRAIAQASALNEAYLRLIEVTQVQWQNRAHFFAMASRLAANLVDAAREGPSKRNAGGPLVSLDRPLPWRRHPQDFVALDDALNALGVDQGSARWSRCASSAA
jgi:hypothetical protein